MIPTAVGGNVDRLGALAAGPVAACVLAGRSALRRVALLLAAPFLLYWQVNAPVADFAAATSNPAVRASYYAPLLEELRVLGVGYAARPARIEVVPTSVHWEAVFLAAHIAIARGWERQLDRYRNALFYDESTPLTPARYHAWLSLQAISYVALPDASLDYSAISEGRLLRSAGGRGALLRKSGARPTGGCSPCSALVRSPNLPPRSPSSAVTPSRSSRPGPGRYPVRVHFTSYWALSRGRGCVGEAPGGWTELEAPRAGSLHVVIDFSLARVFSHGPRCR